MSTHGTDLAKLDVDEAWLLEWAAEGIAALERYLAKHAAFAAYLQARTLLQSDHGDGAAAA